MSDNTDNLAAKLLNTMDAAVWAKEFCRITGKEHPADIDTMRAWFANAIMAGYDIGRQKLRDEIGLTVAQNRRMVPVGAPMPPPVIVDAAYKVGAWFEKQNIKEWELGPCKNRFGMQPPVESGTVDTPELLRMMEGYAVGEVAYRKVLAHIEQDKAQAVKAAGEAGAIVGWNGALAEARAEVRSLQDNLETFGPHSQETARVALDGALEAIDGLRTPQEVEQGGKP
jgi:hypothetical protein